MPVGARLLSRASCWTGAREIKPALQVALVDRLAAAVHAHDIPEHKAPNAGQFRADHQGDAAVQRAVDLLGCLAQLTPDMAYIEVFFILRCNHLLPASGRGRRMAGGPCAR